mmetsp:Transcript_38935/g.71929  ORF Transcript_38935/g.71929 Transcript_38935/m.71929 type:complete len:116 (-) Transcript_38935:242-589(-)
MTNKTDLGRSWLKGGYYGNALEERSWRVRSNERDSAELTKNKASNTGNALSTKTQKQSHSWKDKGQRIRYWQLGADIYKLHAINKPQSWPPMSDDTEETCCPHGRGAATRGGCGS